MPPKETQQNSSTDRFMQLLADMHKILSSSVTHDEMLSGVKALVGQMQQLESRMTENMAKNMGKMDTSMMDVCAQIVDLEKKILGLLDTTRTEGSKELNTAVKQIQQYVNTQLDQLASQIPTLPDYTEQFKTLESKIPTNIQNLNGEDIRNYLEALNGGDRLSMSAIDGLIEALQEIKTNTKTPGRIGPAMGLRFLIDGVKKGLISNVNFVAGTNVAIAYSKVNGQDTITFNASGSGSGGVSVETPPESPNASLKIFTVSAKPKWVVSDGVTYFENQGYTYAALQITMDIAPSASVRVIL